MKLYKAHIEDLDIKFEECEWVDYKQGELVNSRPMLLRYKNRPGYVDGYQERLGPWAPYSPWQPSRELAVQILRAELDDRYTGRPFLHQCSEEFMEQRTLNFSICTLWLAKNKFGLKNLIRRKYIKE